MTFTARIIRGSPTWRLWTNHHRTGGVISGVRFQWATGGDFVAGNLAPHQIGALQNLPDVRLEMIAAPMPPSLPEPVHQPETVPQPEPVHQPMQQHEAVPQPMQQPESFHVKQPQGGMSTLRASEDALKRMKGPRR